MTLRLKINLIVGALTLLFLGAVLALQFRSMRESVHEEVVAAAAACGLPLYPGVATATEAQRAWNMGFRLLKFFPAGPAGGIPMIRALASVFRDVRFMPTGGVSAANLADYLAVPEVIACGGSWLTPPSAIASGDFDAITDLAQAAVALARRARG